ncbi:MAG TPA: hypothetical protein VFO65_04430, partial [Acidimicrobiales bacterium]|nr:hypothetical protein [Acidimicrobiales bacterium]
PALFSGDGRVRALMTGALVVAALLQPVAGVVFVLDGVLIGAGDLGYLAKAMAVSGLAVFVPAALVVLGTGGPLLALWGAFSLLMLARLVGNVSRFAGTGWQVVGADPGRPD